LPIFNEDAAVRALDAMAAAMRVLERFAFSCRKALGNNTLLRELLVPFGSSGYVVLFRIDRSDTVTIAAIRHHREDDYY